MSTKFHLLLLSGLALFGDADIDILNTFLENGVNNHVYPGAVGVVGSVDGLLYSNAVGRHSYDKNDTLMKLETLFDLASLTKVVSTTSVVALLYQMGLISLDTKIGTILGDEFMNGGKENITVLNCLLHNAGFSPDPVPWYWDPSFGCPNTAHEYPEEDFSCLNSMIYNSFLTETLVTPPGEVYVYSDLSFITLQMVVGTIVQQNNLVTTTDTAHCLSLTNNQENISKPQHIVCAFEAFVRTQVFHRPMNSLLKSKTTTGMHNTISTTDNTIDTNSSTTIPTTDETQWMSHTGYLPPSTLWNTCAPTLNDTGSGSYTHKRLQGQVADGDCYAMGGIAGHAGVFSTVSDVAKLAQYWLTERMENDDFSSTTNVRDGSSSSSSTILPFLNATTVKLFSTLYNSTQSSRALGWSTNTPLVSSISVYGSSGWCENSVCSSNYWLYITVQHHFDLYFHTQFTLFYWNRRRTMGMTTAAAT